MEVDGQGFVQNKVEGQMITHFENSTKGWEDNVASLSNPTTCRAYYPLRVLRSKKRIWKKWGLSKGGKYRMSYYATLDVGTSYRVSYDLTLKPPRKGRIVKIPLLTNSISDTCIVNWSCVPRDSK